MHKPTLGLPFPNLVVDTKWIARLLTARNYGRFKEACEELGRSYRCSQH